jgi:hypothetical protein
MDDRVADAMYWVLFKGPWPDSKPLPEQHREAAANAGELRAAFATRFPSMMADLRTPKKRKVKV